jgi:hypothetical protein
MVLQSIYVAHNGTLSARCRSESGPVYRPNVRCLCPVSTRTLGFSSLRAWSPNIPQSHPGNRPSRTPMNYQSNRYFAHRLSIIRSCVSIINGSGSSE